MPLNTRGQRTVRPSASEFGSPSNGGSSTLSVPSQLNAGTTTSSGARSVAWTRNGTVVRQRPERTSSRYAPDGPSGARNASSESRSSPRLRTAGSPTRRTRQR